jgi:transcriptional activator SPT8
MVSQHIAPQTSHYSNEANQNPSSSASHDILRIYDVAQSDSARHRTVPFTIVPGHRGGVISSIYLDPTCRFMLSSAGNRGWEGGGTEVLLGYEIGIQDENGLWHK